MVQAESPSPGERTVSTAECQTPWVLQLLRGARQLRQFERVLSVGAAATSEVAESTEPTPELHLGWLSHAKAALRTYPTTHCGVDQTSLSLDLHAGASIDEEPGAGKLHAGICALPSMSISL